MRVRHKIAVSIALALTFVVPATSVFAAAEPIDGPQLRRDLFTFFVQMVGDFGSLVEPIVPPPPIQPPVVEPQPSSKKLAPRWR